MSNPDLQQPVEARHRQRVIVWLVMAVSIVMYFIVARVIEPRVTRSDPTLVTVLLVTAVSMVAMSFAVKSRAQAGRIIALVLCEAAALFGIVVRIVAGSPRYWVFLLLGLVGVLLHYPRREE